MSHSNAAPPNKPCCCSRRSPGRAAVMSGAHRCASRAFSTCDGSTEVCGRGTLQGYRDSDVGHNTSTLFHAAHVLLVKRWPNSLVLSLHGMREDAEGVRTSLIVSNGIRAEDNGAATRATRLRLFLGSKMKAPDKVVSCNVAADTAYEFRKLCGYTNVQGRHINGDAPPDVCRTSVDQGTGRFIHLEQDWTVLQPYAEGWARIDEHDVHRHLVSALGLACPAGHIRAP